MKKPKTNMVKNSKSKGNYTVQVAFMGQSYRNFDFINLKRFSKHHFIILKKTNKWKFGQHK